MEPSVKPNILFVHTVCPSQFSDLCEHLNETGAATAYYMTTPGNLERNKATYKNLLPLTPDGNMMAANSYYYSGKVERGGRIALGLYRQLKEFTSKRKIDLVVAHGSLGCPHFIFDEFDIPVITYIEFPSYADHGWDPRFPPTEGQRLTDKNMQMLSYYEAIKSARVLVPTDYAKKMFPAALQNNIVAQFEGMVPEKVAQREPANIALPENKKTLGFAARDLSTAKGLETFITTAAELIQRRQDIHFVVIGDAMATTYGYERIFLDRKYGKEAAVSFLDHLLRQHKLDKKHFTFTGKLPYAQFSDLVHNVDLFMYPVKYGSGNWGLVELLIRGRPIVAAHNCYVGEMIEHGSNGLLVDTDKASVWADAVMDLMNDDTRRIQLGENAIAQASKFYLAEVASKYMALFKQVIQEFRR